MPSIVAAHSFAHDEEKLRKWAVPVTATILLLVAGIMLYFRFQRYRFDEVLNAAANLSPRQLLRGAALTLASYGVLTLYDRLAVSYIGAKVPYPRVAVASLTSYAFCNTIGLSLLTGSLIRWNFYRGREIRTEQIPNIVVFCILTSWAGLLFLSGVMLLIKPLLFARSLAVSIISLHLTAMFLIAVCAAYLLHGRSQVSSFRLFSLRLPVPRSRLAATQVLTAALNWLLVAGVINTVLPVETKLTYFDVVGIFVVAQGLGLLSQIPGGLGVFEASFMLMMGRLVSSDVLPTVAGSLLVYRGMYSFLPFALMILVHTSYFLGKRAVVLRRSRY